MDAYLWGDLPGRNRTFRNNQIKLLIPSMICIDIRHVVQINHSRPDGSSLAAGVSRQRWDDPFHAVLLRRLGLTVVHDIHREVASKSRGTFCFREA